MIRGYLRRPEQTAQSFTGAWLHSGDLAVQDDDGYIRIAGRAKDLVISGGYNIYPLEIEALFLTHPKVARAAGVGLKDPQWGERFVMAIIAKEGIPIETLEAELRLLAGECLASYKRPKQYVFMKQLRTRWGRYKNKIRARLSPPVNVHV